MTPEQRAALIDHLIDSTHRLGITENRGFVADLVDGPLAPVIDVLAATFSISEVRSVDDLFAAVEALDPVWLGEG